MVQTDLPGKLRLKTSVSSGGLTIQVSCPYKKYTMVNIVSADNDRKSPKAILKGIADDFAVQ